VVGDVSDAPEILGVISVKGAQMVATALLTQMSMRPSSLSARAVAASTCAWSAVSATMAMAMVMACGDPRRSASARAASKRSGSRAISAIFASWWANSLTVARPMPALAQAITTISCAQSGMASPCVYQGKGKLSTRRSKAAFHYDCVNVMGEV
jgi:hypothetical protein